MTAAYAGVVEWAAPVAFFAAGLAKGVVGLGLPTIAIGLLSIFLAPMESAALLVLPSLVTNIWQALAGPYFQSLTRRLWPMFAGIGLGAWIGFELIPRSGTTLPAAALGAALVIYALLGIRNVRFRTPQRRAHALASAIGIATGAVTSATGVFAIPSAPYLQALGLTKDELVQALGITFTVSTIALAAVLAGDRMLLPAVGWLSFACVGTTVLGMLAGQRLRGRIDEARFRQVFFLSLLVVGAYIAGKALF